MNPLITNGCRKIHAGLMISTNMIISLACTCTTFLRYTFFFERILAKLVGDDEFTLP